MTGVDGEPWVGTGVYESAHSSLLISMGFHVPVHKLEQLVRAQHVDART